MHLGFVPLLLAALSSLALCSAADDPTGSLPGVLDLTPETFDKHVNGAKDALVEFYAPWCGESLLLLDRRSWPRRQQSDFGRHCKHLTPEYKKLGAAVAANPALKNRVVIAKVDADAHRSLGERFGVQGFPTLKYFHRGKPTTAPSDYSGARTQEGFLEFINKALEADKGFARVPSLDSLAASFSTAKDPKQVVADLTAKVGKLTDKTQQAAGALYVKYAQKAAEKGAKYFGTEKTRLERLLQGGNIGSSKLQEISQKLSVLSAYDPIHSAEE